MTDYIDTKTLVQQARDAAARLRKLDPIAAINVGPLFTKLADRIEAQARSISFLQECSGEFMTAYDRSIDREVEIIDKFMRGLDEMLDTPIDRRPSNVWKCEP